MADFTPDFLDSICDRVPLVDIVSPHVALKRAGREFKGLSPFKTEKTPSFTVVPEKGFYHCFASGEHGNVIDFVMKIEGLSFPEAVEKLAARAGLDMPRRDPQAAGQARQRQTIQDALEAAAVFHEKQLRMPDGREAMAYLRGRGLDDETISRFRLGWAPANGEALPQTLVKEGFENKVLVASGMVHAPRDDGDRPWAMLRGRVVFPVTDRRDRVIAFGGRTLGDGQPKYLNTAESPVFQKRQTLYGLAQAREEAWRKREIVVVEGYMDAIALSQAGFPQTVAALGTALGEDHLKALWQIVDEPVFCFDGDEAGQKAARRVAERSLKVLEAGKSVRFATLPQGKDPDDLVRGEGGPDTLRELLESAQSLAGLLWTSELLFEKPQSASAKAGCLRVLVKLCGTIKDKDLAAFHEREILDLCHKEFGVLAAAPQGLSNRSRSAARADRPVPLGMPSGNTIRAMRIILAIVEYPQLAHEFTEEINQFECNNKEVEGLLARIVALTAQETGEMAGPPDISWPGLKEAGYMAAVNLICSWRKSSTGRHVGSLEHDDFEAARAVVKSALNVPDLSRKTRKFRDADDVRQYRKDKEEYSRQQLHAPPPRMVNPAFWND